MIDLDDLKNMMNEVTKERNERDVELVNAIRKCGVRVLPTHDGVLGKDRMVLIISNELFKLTVESNNESR